VHSELRAAANEYERFAGKPLSTSCNRNYLPTPGWSPSLPVGFCFLASLILMVWQRGGCAGQEITCRTIVQASISNKPPRGIYFRGPPGLTENLATRVLPRRFDGGSERKTSAPPPPS
jgi:hypothetical protein